MDFDPCSFFLGIAFSVFFALIAFLISEQSAHSACKYSTGYECVKRWVPKGETQ